MATNLEAAPAAARLLPNLRLFFPDLNARLTVLSSGSPLVDRTIKFSAAGHFICFAQTDTNGVARCKAKAPLRALFGFGFAAKFRGDRDHLRSVDFASIVSVSVPQPIP